MPLSTDAGMIVQRLGHSGGDLQQLAAIVKELAEKVEKLEADHEKRGG